MKKILVISLIVVFVLGFAVNIDAMGNMYAEEWSELDEQAKKVYLSGVFDGLNVAVVGIIGAFEPDKELHDVAEELSQEGELEITDEDHKQELINMIDDKITEDESVISVILKHNILDEEIEGL